MYEKLSRADIFSGTFTFRPHINGGVTGLVIIDAARASLSINNKLTGRKCCIPVFRLACVEENTRRCAIDLNLPYPLRGL
jgi:hypothetical protein